MAKNDAQEQKEVKQAELPLNDKRAPIADMPLDAVSGVALAERPARSTELTTVGGYDIEDVGLGFEDMDRSHFSIPFLFTLQTGSPQVKEGSGKEVPNARASMLINSVTQQLYDGKKGAVVIPCYVEHKFLEWIPRDQGGGLAGVHEVNSPIIAEAIRLNGGSPIHLMSADGNNLKETFSVSCLVLSEDGQSADPVVISFASTQIKEYKAWMSKAKLIRIVQDGRRFPAPLMATRWRITTTLQKNNDGDWYGMVVRMDGATPEEARVPADSPLYAEAKSFRDVLRAGTRGIDYSVDAARSPDADLVNDDSDL